MVLRSKSHKKPSARPQIFFFEIVYNTARLRPISDNFTCVIINEFLRDGWCQVLKRYIFLELWNSWLVINLSLVLLEMKGFLFDVPQTSASSACIGRFPPPTPCGEEGLMIRNPAVSRYISNPFGCESCTLSNGWLVGEKGNWVNRACIWDCVGCFKFYGLDKGLKRLKKKMRIKNYSYNAKIQ